MKKQVLFAATFLLATVTNSMAQEKEVIRKGNKEIIITKEGDKETTVTVEVDDSQPPYNNRGESRSIIMKKDGESGTTMMVEINGDDVKINGKPADQFNENGTQVRKKKMIIVNGQPLQEDFVGEEMPGNFSINSDVKKFKEEKSDTVAFLGVTTEPNEKGILITEIVSGSAADKAGLQKEDVILAIDEEIVTDPQGLTAIIRKHQQNDVVKISYSRNGKNKSCKATLQQKIIKSTIQKKVIIQTDKNEDTPEVFGITIPDMSDITQAFPFPKKQKLGIKIQDTEEGIGVKVLEVESGSAAEKAGLQKDDLIIEIAESKVNNTDEAREQLQEQAEKNQYKIKANRNGKAMIFDIIIPKKLKTANL